MSKSDNIYNALDFARNKLKSAAEAKGATVASPLQSHGHCRSCADHRERT